MARSLILLCLFTVLKSVSSEEAAATCTTPGPLGMENGFIQDTQIKASVFHSMRPPKEGRLNNRNHWAASTPNPTDPWIQVDFLDTGNEVYVTGILTQGGSVEKYQSWVSKLQIQTGDSEESLTYIVEGNQPKTFDASSDRVSIATIQFPETIRTRYLRILPTEWVTWVALRFEVIGCQTVIPTSKATFTTDKANASPFLGTSQSDDRSYQSQTHLSAAHPTSKATSTTDKTSTSPYISTSQSDDAIYQTRTDLSTGPIVGVAVGLSIAVILIILSVFCILKIRRNRDNQPKPDTSSSKPPEVDQPYSLAVLESKPNQQSDSGVIQPVYADPNQDDPSQSTLSYDDIPKSSTVNDPDAIYYSSVGSTSGPNTTNGQTSDIYTKVENIDAPEGSLYYATSDTPEDEEGCVENAAYDSFEGNGGKENGADDAEGWEDNTLYGAGSRQDEDASGWKDNDIYSGVDD